MSNAVDLLLWCASPLDVDLVLPTGVASWPQLNLCGVLLPRFAHPAFGISGVVVRRKLPFLCLQLGLVCALCAVGIRGLPPYVAVVVGNCACVAALRAFIAVSMRMPSFVIALSSFSL